MPRSDEDQAISKASMRITWLEQGEEERAGGVKEENQLLALMENYLAESYS